MTPIKAAAVGCALLCTGGRKDWPMSEETRPPSFLAIAPFPLLNPLNWGAMTPTLAVSAAINLNRLTLKAWRAAFDASCSMWREQQDASLQALEETLARAMEKRAAEPAPEADAADEPHRVKRRAA